MTRHQTQATHKPMPSGCIHMSAMLRVVRGRAAANDVELALQLSHSSRPTNMPSSSLTVLVNKIQESCTVHVACRVAFDRTPSVGAHRHARHAAHSAVKTTLQVFHSQGLDVQMCESRQVLWHVQALHHGGHALDVVKNKPIRRTWADGPPLCKLRLAFSHPYCCSTKYQQQ